MCIRDRRRTGTRPRSHQTTLAICLDLRLGKSMGTFFNCSPAYNYRIFASYSHSRPKQRALLEKASPRYRRSGGFYTNFCSPNYLGQCDNNDSLHVTEQRLRKQINIYDKKNHNQEILNFSFIILNLWKYKSTS